MLIRVSAETTGSSSSEMLAGDTLRDVAGDGFRLPEVSDARGDASIYDCIAHTGFSQAMIMWRERGRGRRR